MYLISHRGNIYQKNTDLENSPSYIESAIKQKFIVEIDVRLINNNFFLGHDLPQYKVNKEWLLSNRKDLLIHCKNVQILKFCLENNLIAFFHSLEDHTPIINTGFIWTHKIEESTDLSFIPLIDQDQIKDYKKFNFAGICSDYVGLIR